MPEATGANVGGYPCRANISGRRFQGGGEAALLSVSLVECVCFVLLVLLGAAVHPCVFFCDRRVGSTRTTA